MANICRTWSHCWNGRHPVWANTLIRWQTNILHPQVWTNTTHTFIDYLHWIFSYTKTDSTESRRLTVTKKSQTITWKENCFNEQFTRHFPIRFSTRMGKLIWKQNCYDIVGLGWLDFQSAKRCLNGRQHFFQLHLSDRLSRNASKENNPKRIVYTNDELSGFLKQSDFERTKLCCIITNSDESVDLLLDGL